MPSLYIGTSGYRYWPGDIHPPKTSSDEALKRYAAVLPAVEMNRTFYQLPRATTIAKWRSLVPKTFVFAVKIWKRLTHEKKLVDIEADWTTFLDRIRPALHPSGVLLLQLSKTFPLDPERLETFLKLVPSGIRIGVEFRAEGWFRQPTYRLLEKYQAALVGVGAPGVTRVLDVRTAPFTYLRLHGPRQWYKDRYSAEDLAPFIRAAQSALAHGEVYTFFDNTIGGHAYWNALEFQDAIVGHSLAR